MQGDLRVARRETVGIADRAMRPAASSTPQPSATVEPRAWPAFTSLVAAWNEAASIAVLIASFRDLRWPKSRLVVCAGGGDGTFEIARRLAGHDVVVLEQTPGMGKQAALRASLRHAIGGYVHLTDADCRFDRAALEALFVPLLDGPYAVASGGAVPFPDQFRSPLIQYQACRNQFFHDHAGDEAGGILGRNALLTRTVLDRIGAFEADVATGTDYHMSMRLAAAGVAVAHAKSSCVPTSFPTSATDYVRRWRRWTKNLMIHDARRHALGFTKSVGLACALLFAPASVFVMPSPWLAAPFILLFLAGLIPRYRDVRYGRRAGITVAPITWFAIPWFMLLDQIAVLAAARDLVDANARRRW